MLVLWLLDVCGVTVACAQADGFDWRHGILAVSAAVAGMAASTGALRWADPAELGFDGQDWSLSGGVPLRSARATTALDLQSLLLVCLTEPGRSRHWIWVERQAKPESWRDLRRALYSRAPLAASTARNSNSGAADAHHFSS
ncbi:hypothetical protein [Variovorax sp. GT1P44]|uniref:hypothetical protein n=1 Tax=Variovorax sp. GT1P44 TaxID=3443742 RepID=UPI003F476D86